MQYSTDNVTLSLQRQLSELLMEEGWNIFWHASQVTEPHTSGLPSAKGTIVIIPEIPDRVVDISGLSIEDTEPHQVALPVFSVHVGNRVQDRIGGLGHADYFWHREIRIDGLVRNSFEHTKLADLFSEWLEGDNQTKIRIWDFDSDETGSTELRAAEVLWSSVRRTELSAEENPLVRYYLGAVASIEYIE